MSEMHVVYTVDKKKAVGLVNGLDAALSDQGLFMFLHTRVSPWLRTRAKARFAGEGDDAVGQWAPLKQVTKDIRRTQGYPEGPINKRTGFLERYIMGDSDVATTGNMALLTHPGSPPTGIVKDSLITAQFGREDTGDPDHPKTVARPVLGLSAVDLIEVLSTMDGHLKLFTGRYGR